MNTKIRSGLTKLGKQPLLSLLNLTLIKKECLEAPRIATFILRGNLAVHSYGVCVAVAGGVVIVVVAGAASVEGCAEGDGGGEIIFIDMFGSEVAKLAPC